MQTQQDHSVRVVALVNLRAMCERVSGWAHRFEISKVSRSRVHVTYSNPDEWGAEDAMTAVFPCYPSGFSGDEENPRVVLDMLRVINDTWGGEGWQAFAPLLDCPQLWRGGREPVAPKDWRTREEWERVLFHVGDIVETIGAAPPAIGLPGARGMVVELSGALGRAAEMGYYVQFGAALYALRADELRKVSEPVTHVRLLVDKSYPATWVLTFPPIKAGSVVPVTRATNQPQDGQGRSVRFWVDTPELQDDASGIGLYDGEFQIVSAPDGAQES
jgi:hypothetical protein